MLARLAPLVVFGALLAGCRGDETDRRTIFEDDFATDRGWTGNVPSEIFVDTAAGVIRWRAERSHVQYLARPLAEPVTGDVTIDVVGQVDWTANNCHVAIGLSDGLAGAGPRTEPPGVYVITAFTGGGCSNQHFYSQGKVVFGDGATLSLGGGHVCNGADGTDIRIPQAQPIRTRVRVAGSTLSAVVRDAVTGVELGRLSGAMPKTLNPFTHVLVGNYDDQDWPAMEGTIDSIAIGQP